MTEKQYTEEYKNVVKGQYIAFSSGEWSDYAVGNFAVVLKDFNMSNITRKWEREENPYGNDSTDIGNKQINYDSGCIGFEPYLVKNKYIEILEYEEFNTGGFGVFSL